MSKYDIEYLRNMTVDDFASEPKGEIIQVLLEHLDAVSGRQFTKKAVEQYNKIFLKYYDAAWLPVYLESISHGSQLLSCVNVGDPKFVVKFKFRVMTHGDEIAQRVLNGIQDGYIDFSPRHVIMFMYAYMYMQDINIRLLVDFFSGMYMLSDDEVLECTKLFMQKTWTLDKVVAHLSSDVTLPMLYLRWKKYYTRYVKSYIMWHTKKERYDIFYQRKLPVIPRGYKPDRGLFAL